MKMELLAPAGAMAALEAAIESGADAVYLGLNTLNARRGAENFSQDSLAVAVSVAHEKGVKVFLTLNIDLAPREIGEAARILQLASDCGIDAVLFTDPAVLALSEHFPKMEFHFSTQASVTSSAGVRAAAKLGVKRVVLARELALSEIREAVIVGRELGVEVEVFVQGALCMCVSGRCLLSSWGGGRSGNRGSCTSPCRVRWNDKASSSTNKPKELGTFLAMRDLCALDYLEELAEMGVACVKIEGRLKSAQWVRDAVTFYRRALAGEKVGLELESSLGAYAGREMTAGYLTGHPEQMTGEYGRLSSGAEEPAEVAPVKVEPVKLKTQIIEYNLEILSSGDKLECCLSCEFGEERWQMVKTRVRHEKRAVTLEQTAGWLQNFKIQGAELETFSCDDNEYQLPRKTVNLLADKISAALHRLRKTNVKKGVQVELDAQVRELVRLKDVTGINQMELGYKPNMVRLDWSQAPAFMSEISPELVVVENIAAAQLSEYKALGKNSRLVVSLPSVFFENDVADLRELCRVAADLKLIIEVNGWDGWQLAAESGADIIAGSGLAILNPLAAQALKDLGFMAACYSLEAGQKQYEDLARTMPLPGILYVYGRPVLACTRARITQEEKLSVEDSRGIKLDITQNNGLYYLRASEAYNLAQLKNERIKARYLCVDLSHCVDPVREWNNIRKQRKNANIFNYERGLY